MAIQYGPWVTSGPRTQVALEANKTLGSVSGLTFRDEWWVVLRMVSRSRALRRGASVSELVWINPER